MKYSEIDLHSNNSVVTVTDEEDRVVAEKRLPNDLTKIVQLLTPWREELAGVVVESWRVHSSPLAALPLSRFLGFQYLAPWGGVLY